MLRAFPAGPGSQQWVVQNIEKRTEYAVDVEAVTCTCEGFSRRHRCKHLDYALKRARLYSGVRNEEYEEFAAALVKAAA